MHFTWCVKKSIQGANLWPKISQHIGAGSPFAHSLHHHEKALLREDLCPKEHLILSLDQYFKCFQKSLIVTS